MKVRLITLFSVTFVIIGFLLLWKEFPDMTILKNHYPLFKRDQIRKTKITFLKTHPYRWITLEQISKPAISAIVISEDWAFYQHKGYDPNQIKEAIETNLKAKRIVRGASTITQQVVRNVFLNKKKTMWRKIKEMILAARLEKVLSKKRILEIYLNIAEWGEGIYGIQQASTHYFNKPPIKLSAKEGAFLAMLLPSPKRYSRIYLKKGLTENAYEKIDLILRKMSQAQYLTEEEYRRELSAGLLLGSY